MQPRLYSVWDWRTGSYAYFIGGPAIDAATPPNAKGLGVPPEAIAPHLPRDARLAGRGIHALGTIAVVR